MWPISDRILQFWYSDWNDWFVPPFSHTPQIPDVPHPLHAFLPPIPLLHAFTNNEAVLNELTSIPIINYLGFDDWFNLDLIAHLNPRQATIYCSHRSLFHIYQVVQEEIISAPDCDIFIRRLIDTLHTIPSLHATDLLRIDEISSECFRRGSWLSESRFFEVVRELYRQGAITHAYIDIKQVDQFPLHAAASFDTIYVSDSAECFAKNHHYASAFTHHLQALASPNSRFIEAHPITPLASEPIKATHRLYITQTLSLWSLAELWEQLDRVM